MVKGCHTRGSEIETEIMPGAGLWAQPNRTTPYPLVITPYIRYSSHTTAANPTVVIVTKYGRAIHTIRP